MRFWDSSALVPLVVEERWSGRLRALFRENSELIVWACTETELFSALHRRRREGALGAAAFPKALARLEGLTRLFSEVSDLVTVRAEARALIERHWLSAADTLQLAAARTACGGDTASCEFVCLDTKLSAAASLEKFIVFKFH